MLSNEVKTILGASDGGRLITGTTAVTGAFVAIVINEDTVFDELEIDGVDVMAARGLDGADTVTAGMYLGSGFHFSAGNSRSVFTKIKLTSGSIIAY